MSASRQDELLLRIVRLDGGELVLDGGGLARLFFEVDPSSVGVGAYDSLAGIGRPDRIEIADVQALNRTMRARSAHARWADLVDRELVWLREIPLDLDLIETDDDGWAAARGDELVRAALSGVIAHGRGASVATKLLHLKRPRLFPILDALVVDLLGRSAPEAAATQRRVGEEAARVVVHLRREGRRNVDALRAIQERLAAEGYQRSLVRILDAALWLSHPAAGGPRARRRFTVDLLSRDELAG